MLLVLLSTTARHPQQQMRAMRRRCSRSRMPALPATCGLARSSWVFQKTSSLFFSLFELYGSFDEESGKCFSKSNNELCSNLPALHNGINYLP